MSEQKPKVAIVGGGPAGATLSLFFSKYEIPHVLFEKEIFPRDKICGDGFTMEVHRTLSEIDPALAKEYREMDFVEPSGGFYFKNNKGKEVIVDMRTEGADVWPFYIAKRLDFDNWLFQKTKQFDFADIREGFAVKGIERKGNGFEVEFDGGKEYFDFLIGADGERSVVKKYLTPEGIKKNREHHAGAIKAYFKGVVPAKDFKPLELYPLDGVNGYFWIFHLPDGVSNVGIGGLSSEISEKKINLKKEMMNFIETSPMVKDRFAKGEQLTKIEGWGIPLNSNRADYYGDGYLLIGDSASMAEPATGKGIGIAMFVAYLSIPILREAIANKDFSKKQLKKFQDKVLEVYDKEWRGLKKAQDKLYHPFWSWVVFNVLGNKFVSRYYSKKAAEKVQKFLIPKGWKY